MHISNNFKKQRTSTSSTAERILVIVMMIGSMVSSIRCANSFTPNKLGRYIKTTATISSTASSSRSFSSIVPATGVSWGRFSPKRGNAFRRHAKENNGEGRSTNSSLFMSSVAAVSLTGGAITGKNTTTTTLCAENDDEGTVVVQPEPENFPEEALIHDTYNGVTLHISKLSSKFMTDNAKQFVSTLTHSLKSWKSDNKRGIWIHVPTEHSIVVPKCVELGFEFQHAKNGLLVLTRWLPEDQESRLPHGPTHQLGVGIILLHPVTKKMLVVQEKSGPAAARKLWKMPTGLTDPGEDIVDAAIREAKEETGLDCVFDKILCMRQAHGGIFNQSDMFIVCSLKLSPKYDEILRENKEIELIPQEEEIAMIDWMEVDDFSGQELWQGSPLYEELNETINLAKKTLEYNEDENKTEGGSDQKYGFVAKKLPVGFRPGENTIYLSSL